MSQRLPQLAATLDRMEFGRKFKAELLKMNKPLVHVPYAQPLLDAVSLFETLGIHYALIGGVASMYYGRARFTEDVDFVAVAGHMEILAAHSQEMEQHHFAPECTHKLYHNSGVNVDIWKDEYADKIIANAVDVELAGRVIRIIEPHDLIAMKLRAGRLKDDYDIGEIVSHSSIDEVRLSSIITLEQMKYFSAIVDRMRTEHS